MSQEDSRSSPREADHPAGCAAERPERAADRGPEAPQNSPSDRWHGVVRGAPAPSGAKLLAGIRRDLGTRLVELATAVDELTADRGFHHLLAGMTRLWRYSLYNQCFIDSQRPGATAVMGRKQWLLRGRTVRDGEEPIYVLAPWRGRRSGWPFVFVDVFDISQTEGPPVPEVPKLPSQCEHLPAIESAAPLLGLRVKQLHSLTGEVAPGGVVGMARGGVIEIAACLSPRSRAAVLIHEYAHELLHVPASERRRDRPTHSVRETEAEATAYVVLSALGVPCAAPSYIVWMGGHAQDIIRSMSRIRTAAAAILTAVQGRRPRPRIPAYAAPRENPTAGRAARRAAATKT